MATTTKKTYLLEVHEDRVYNVEVKAGSVLEAEQEAVALVAGGGRGPNYKGRPRVISTKVKK